MTSSPVGSSVAPDSSGVGRFAPSPSGQLHLGNLRTALLAWLAARASGRGFVVRMEDLDRDRTVPGAAAAQLADLAALGLDWDGDVWVQSARFTIYADVVAVLTDRGLTYECFCTRREIREASSAPQATSGRPLPDGAYPGTCRDLSEDQQAERRAAGRPPAIRLRAGVTQWPVDDAAQGIDQVVRGDDLLSSAPRQAYLADLLGLPVPGYAHVPLALNPAGQRLAKRDGAVTLTQLGERGVTPAQVLSRLAASAGLAEPGEPVTAADLVPRFSWAALPDGPWIVDPA